MEGTCVFGKARCDTNNETLASLLDDRSWYGLVVALELKLSLVSSLYRIRDSAK